LVHRGILSEALFRLRSESTSLAPSQNNPHGIGVHSTQGIFWADQSDQSIFRANFDGTGQTPLVTGTLAPRALTIDEVNGRIYWSDNTGVGGANRIQSVKLDGTDQQTFVTFGNSSDFSGIDVDPSGGKLYWVDTNVVGIFRRNLDGSGSTESIFSHIAGTGGPNAIGVDPVGGKMYWSASGLTNTIEWADLDGSNRQTLISGGLANTNGVAVDSLGGKVYWESNFGIERANLDGTGRETISGSANAFAIALGPASALSPIPEPTTFTLLGIGCVSLLGYRWRKRRVV